MARGLVAWAALTVLLIHIAAAVCRRPRRRGYEDHRDDFLPLMLSNQEDEKCIFLEILYFLNQKGIDLIPNGV